LIIPILIIIINVFSTEALGIILSMYNSALVASYMITISCVLLHRLQGNRLPQSRYSLGKWGGVVNCLALLYVTPIFVFSFFPAAPQPTAVTMNWAIALVGGIALLATIYYIIWARYTYSPPDDTVEDYIQRFNATSASSEKEGSAAFADEKVPEPSVDEAGMEEPVVEEAKRKDI
jgi:hypothetical protein